MIIDVSDISTIPMEIEQKILERFQSMPCSIVSKRDKSSITPFQEKKIKAILLNSIKPYLQKELKNKIVR